MVFITILLCNIQQERIATGDCTPDGNFCQDEKQGRITPEMAAEAH
jgi:hypothetical protein